MSKKRHTPEQIISKLADELAKLGLPAGVADDAPVPVEAVKNSEAMAILIGQLGLRTAEAEELISRATTSLGTDAEINDILEEVFRLRR